MTDKWTQTTGNWDAMLRVGVYFFISVLVFYLFTASLWCDQQKLVLYRISYVSAERVWFSDCGFCSQKTSNETWLAPPAKPFLDQKKKVHDEATQVTETEVLPPFTLSEFNVSGWKISATVPIDRNQHSSVLQPSPERRRWSSSAVLQEAVRDPILSRLLENWWESCHSWYSSPSAIRPQVGWKEQPSSCLRL